MRALPLLVLAACSSQAGPGAPPPSPTRPAPTPIVPSDPPPDLTKLWPEGCFTFREASGTVHANHRDRCARPRRPYSTFKIANALIAVEAGVLAGPDAEMHWDKKRIPDNADFMEAWRKPHTLRSGMKVSRRQRHRDPGRARTSPAFGTRRTRIVSEDLDRLPAPRIHDLDERLAADLLE